VLSVFGFLSKDMLLMFSSALGGAFFVFSALLFYLILKKIFKSKNFRLFRISDTRIETTYHKWNCR